MRHAAIFDLDGTLIDSAPAIARALDAVRASRGLPAIDPQRVRRWISLGAAALVGHALGLTEGAGSADVAAFRTAYAASPGGADDLYPGIANALAELRRAGVILGICTNKPQALSELVLDASGIAVHFAAVIGGDAVARPKPDGTHLTHTLRAMGCEGLDFDFVGDSRIDADAACAAGARFLWASWGYPDSADLVNRGRPLPSPGALVDVILREVRR